MNETKSKLPPPNSKARKKLWTDKMISLNHPSYKKGDVTVGSFLTAHITKAWTEIGGGAELYDHLVMSDGKVLVIDSERIGLYSSLDAWRLDEEPLWIEDWNTG